MCHNVLLNLLVYKCVLRKTEMQCSHGHASFSMQPIALSFSQVPELGNPFIFLVTTCALCGFVPERLSFKAKSEELRRQTTGNKNTLVKTYVLCRHWCPLKFNVFQFSIYI